MPNFDLLLSLPDLDILPLLFIMLLSVLSIGIGAMKKKQQAAQAQRGVPPQPDVPGSDASPRKPVPAKGEDPFRAAILQRLPNPPQHTFSGTESDFAPFTEGEDPCHADMLIGPQQADVPEPAEPSEGAQELLRGVILSEVLRRRPPCRGRRA